jgi:hypothetical protein
VRPLIRQGVLERLVFRPAEGPASAGSVRLQLASGVERTAAAATGPTTVTTLSSNVTAGALRATLTSVTGIAVGAILWFGSAADARDQVRVSALDVAAKQVYFRRPLSHDHATGEAVSSGELSVLLEAGEVAEPSDNNVAWWTYTVDGVTYRFEQVWDVVLRAFRIRMTPLQLKRYVAPQLLEQTEQTFDELVEQGTWVLSQRLRYFGILPEWVVDTSEFERSLGLLIRLILLGEEVQYAAQRISLLRDFARPDFEEEWTYLMRNRPRWLDKNRDAVVDEDELSRLGTGGPVDLHDFSGLTWKLP